MGYTGRRRIVDCRLLRRCRIGVSDLDTDHPDGEYTYRCGLDPRAPAAFFRFAGALVAGFRYFLAAERTGRFTDVSGEHLNQDIAAEGSH